MSHPLIGRREFLTAAGGALLAGTASQSAAAQSADGSTVYVGSDDATLYAVDAATGEQEWAFTEPSTPVESSPTVVDGTIYVGSATLYAVDAVTGEQEWTFTEPSDGIFSSPTVVDGTVYVGSIDETLYAVDAATGEQEWAFTEPSDGIFSSPTVVDGIVYVGSRDETLYAVDAAEGSQEWAFTEPSDGIFSSPTVVDGIVYVGSSDATLYAVDVATGEQEWAFTDPSDLVLSSPTVVDGTIYVGGDATLYAVDAAEGTEEWAFTDPLGGIVSSPTVVDGTVYVGSFGETLYAVDVATGQREWAFTEPSDIISSSPTVVDGTVYVGSEDETLYAVDAATGEQKWAFTEPSDLVVSSPTVVEEPASGDSVDSRVRLGTLGHHNVLASGAGDSSADNEEATGQLPTEDGDEGSGFGPIEMAKVGGAGTVVTLIGAYLFQQRGTDTDEQSSLPPERSTPESGSSTGVVSSPPDESDTHESGTAAIDQHRDTVDESLDDAQTSHERIESVRPSGQSGGPPETIPRPPALTLTYDDIKPSDSDIIGQGGNADVYRTTVSGQRGDVPVAVKKPRMSGTLHTGTVEQMLEEAEIWQKLDDHDHIVSVIDYGSEPLPWVAMEYMDGGHLRDQAGNLSINQALWTAITTAEAVWHAHRRGVAHLDLKPENVLFRSVEGAWDVPKVADWGLSKHLLDHSKSVEEFSPQYAAPEQFDDSYGDTDDLTDVYQLGAVFYELFTGRPPFEGKPAMVMNKVLNEQPAPLSTTANAPPELDDVLQQALAKHKADRYESVLYLRDDLQDMFDRR